VSLVTVGLILLVAWPAYAVALVVYSARNGLVAARHRQKVDGVAPVAAQPQTFWVVVPCLNEERVVARTVRAALDLAGPHGSRTRVLVVDDGSDDATPDVLAAIEHPDLYVLRRNLPDARKGKGEALNAAYRCIRAFTAANGGDPRRTAVGVIDGDGRGSANMLREVAYAMREEQVGAVQSRVRIHNRDRVLAAVQDLEFGCIADASQSLRDGLGTVGLGGNGQFARLSALMALGESPWSGCLVEDLELGLRMHLAGIQLRYLPHASVTQQGLVDVSRLIRQRTRWAQGNLQCARYVPKLIAARRIGNGQLAEMLYYLLAPWLNAFGAMVMTVLWGRAIWQLAASDGHTFLVRSWAEMGVAVGIWTAAMFVPGLVWAVLHRVKLHDEKLSRLLLAGLLYPLFLFLGLISTWRAIGRHLARRQTWAKTERLAEEPNTPELVGVATAQR
jgi:cellulose synthase/poly-beta-1,6-N-acetylglucosamine synthase-like glycosyltransferase